MTSVTRQESQAVESWAASQHNALRNGAISRLPIAEKQLETLKGALARISPTSNKVYLGNIANAVHGDRGAMNMMGFNYYQQGYQQFVTRQTFEAAIHKFERGLEQLAHLAGSPRAHEPEQAMKTTSPGEGF